MKLAIIFNRAIAASVATAMVAGAPADAGARSVQRRAPAAKARVASLPVGTQRPTSEVLLSVGQGELINLPADVADVWVSNPAVADVYVSNPRQIHLFGKDFGEATVFATSKAGRVVYSTNIRVSQNVTSVDKMLKLAMPDADIRVTTIGQLAVLTGTVAQPADIAQAQQLVAAILNPGVDATAPNATLKINVISRLRTATPLQVNLQVKFAEVSKSFGKNIGANFGTVDSTSGFKFGLAQGRGGGNQFTPGGPLGVGFTQAPTGGSLISQVANGSTLGFAGKLFGLDILSALDLGESNGQVVTLAQPNLSALSGETGTFLAGGEIPIPVGQGLGAVSIEYKQYGVSLSYTPTVLADGRISLRVRPEVSQLSSANAVTLQGGPTVPALTTRRAETTVELGSGQSMVIGGLLENTTNNQISKTPGIGDVPILGALFRSTGWKRDETELVIVITPYLVKPVNANDIVLPTDGYQAPTDLGRVFMGQLGGGQNGGDRPKPSMAAPVTAPSIGATAPVPTPGYPAAPASTREDKALPPKKSKGAATAAPGFSF